MTFLHTKKLLKYETIACEIDLDAHAPYTVHVHGSILF